MRDMKEHGNSVTKPFDDEIHCISSAASCFWKLMRAIFHVLFFTPQHLQPRYHVRKNLEEAQYSLFFIQLIYLNCIYVNRIHDCISIQIEINHLSYILT